LNKSLGDRSVGVVTPALPKYGPSEVERGEGVYLFSPDGNKYLDFAAGIAVAATGHCHPKVVAAIQQQAAKLIHACAHVSWYPGYVELAEELSKIVPALGMVYFANSGTESIEAAIKMARFVTGRPAIVAFQGSFHGRTLGAASLTGKSALRRKYEPLLPAVYHAPYPSCYRCQFHQNPSECSLECFTYLERMFGTVVHPEDTAAIFIEPILGEGGYYVAPDSYLLKLQAFCRTHSILLVVDEVQSGMGRTGKMFAWQHINSFEPDAMTLAKALGSGLPIGALMGKPELMSKWEKGAHGSTFGGNPVSCSAALTTLEVISEESLMENAIRVGNIIFERMVALKDEGFGIGDVRGKGLMLAMEFVKPDGSPDAPRTKKIIEAALDEGLIIIGGGMFGNVLRIVPPMIIKKEQAEEGMDILKKVLRKVQ